MAKRSPILSESYNPVGDRLRRFRSVGQPSVSPEESPSTSDESAGTKAADDASAPLYEPPRIRERLPIPEIPTGPELKGVSVRFRCTPSERKKWHEATRQLSGDHNNLSHFIRAAMLLFFDHANEPLMRLAPDIQRLRKPATTDMLGIVLYEQRLSEFLYDAIRASGHPSSGGV